MEDGRIQGLKGMTVRAATGCRVNEIELVRLVRRLSVEDCALTLSKLAWLAQEDPLAASLLVASWLRESDQERISKASKSSVLMYSARAVAALRVALSHAESGPITDLDSGARRALAMVVLAVLDFDEPDAAPVGGEVLDVVRRMSLQQLSARESAPSGLQLVRMQRLFVALTEERSDPIGLLAAFEETVGLPLDRYLAVTFAMIARWLSWDRDAASWPLTAEYLAATTVTVEEYEIVLAGKVATAEEARRAIEDEIAAGRRGVFDLGAFARFPLLRLSNGWVVPTDPPMLFERLLGDGVYWHLRYVYGQRGRLDAFGAETGKLLERHLAEVAHSELDDVDGIEVFDEVGYREPDGSALGPDLAIWQSGVLTIFEIGATRCRYREVMIQADLDAWHADIERIFTGKDGRASQLDRKITALREGRLAYPGVPADALVIPVVCLLDGFPHGPVLDDDIRQAIKQAGLLCQRDVSACRVISAAEFEALCAQQAVGRSITALLIEWHRTHAARPLLGFLAETYGEEIPKPKLVAGHLEETFSAWIAELGIPPSP